MEIDERLANLEKRVARLERLRKEDNEFFEDLNRQHAEFLKEEGVESLALPIPVANSSEG